MLKLINTFVKVLLNIVNMNGKFKVLSAGVLFFIGGQFVQSQQKKDEAKEKEIEEVVVVGYGTQKKSDVTASLTTVKGSAIADKPVQTFDQAMAGRSTGVQITVPSGVLNAAPVFRIRGTSSISLSSYPLIIIDGVPTFTDNNSTTSAASNPLASINPADIESIDIAKDAAATAIYGSRAANGVVFVTTKKGKSGRAKINYSTWLSVASPFRLPETLGAEDYVKFKNAAVANKLNVSVNELIKKNENRSVGRDLNTGLYSGAKLVYTPKKEKISVAPKPNLQKRYDENLYKTQYIKNVYVTYEGSVITVEEPINYNEILD
jgi:TonB-dependent SusC/RagA subfamily outer membrane receptor